MAPTWSSRRLQQASRCARWWCRRPVCCARSIAACSAAAPAEVPRYRLADALFAHVSPVDSPSGLLATIAMPASAPGDLSDASLIVLDGVQDPGNLGSLLRTAAAAGIHHALLGEGCAQAWSPRALRAGMGAQFVVRIEEGCDLLARIERLSRSLPGHRPARGRPPTLRARPERPGGVAVRGGRAGSVSGAACACRPLRDHPDGGRHRIPQRRRSRGGLPVRAGTAAPYRDEDLTRRSSSEPWWFPVGAAAAANWALELATRVGGASLAPAGAS